MKHSLHRLAPVFLLAVAAAAVWIVQRELQAYDYHDIIRTLRDISQGRLILAIVLTVASYALLTGYDVLALRYSRSSVAYRGIYYLLPLVAATALLAVYEMACRRERVRRVAAGLWRKGRRQTIDMSRRGSA